MEQINETADTSNNINNNTITSFNNMLIEFINDLIHTFPEYKQDYTTILNNIIKNINNPEYIVKFMDNIQPYILEISNKNRLVFIENTINLIDNVDFKTIMSMEDVSINTQNAIWKYIHSLYLLGNNSNLGSSTNNLDLKELLNNKSLENLTQQTQGMLNIIKNLENNNPDANEPEEVIELQPDTDTNIPNPDNLFGDSKIGQLAQELAGEINVNDLGLGEDINDNPAKLLETLMSGDNSNNLMNMIQKVGSKIQSKISNGEVNEAQLLNEAQNLMGGLGDNDLLSNMMKNMGGGGGLGNNKKNKTRDRLRKKLEKKNNPK